MPNLGFLDILYKCQWVLFYQSGQTQTTVFFPCQVWWFLKIFFSFLIKLTVFFESAPFKKMYVYLNTKQLQSMLKADVNTELTPIFSWAQHLNFSGQIMCTVTLNIIESDWSVSNQTTKTMMIIFPPASTAGTSNYILPFIVWRCVCLCLSCG